MKQSTITKATQILLAADTLEKAKSLLLCILKDRPSCIVNAYDFLKTMGIPENVLTWPVKESPLPSPGWEDEVPEKTLDEKRDDCIAEYIRSHQKIASIKWYRLVSDVGLKEAKDKVEDIMRRYQIDAGISNCTYPYDLDSGTKFLIRMIWDNGKEEAAKYLMRQDRILTEAAAMQLVKRCVQLFSLEI